MRRQTSSSRRSFIRRTGAALSAPLAAAGMAVPSAAATTDPAASRLALLEDLDAIRALNHELLRQVEAGEAGQLGVDPGIGRVSPLDFGARDRIEVAPDRRTAIGVLHCSVEIATPIGPSCTLVEMAREQGGGVVRRTETGVFETVYVRRGGRWRVERSIYRPA